MAEVPKLPADQWPEVRRLKAAKNTGWGYFADLVRTLHRMLGEEKTCEILSEFMAENARKYLLPALKSFGIEGNSARTLASYFKLADDDIIGYKSEWIEESPKKVILRLYPPCIWFPELDIPGSFCRAMGSFEQAAAALINPGIKIYGTKLMTDGDPYCELVFEEVEEGG